MLSARLDGEELPGEAAASDAHVAGCAACARWWDEAAAVTRLARLAAVPQRPGRATGGLVPERLAAAAPGPRRRRTALVLRPVLGVLGLAQFLLGMAQVGALSSHTHAPGVGVSPAHLWHESAAWNIAVGAGFGWIALRRTRPHALLPLLTAFVAMLVLLSLNDLGAGTVDGARLVSHGFVAAGYVILVVLSRPGFDFDGPVRGARPPWRAPQPSGGAEPARPPLRLVTRTPAVPVNRWDRAA